MDPIAAAVRQLRALPSEMIIEENVAALAPTELPALWTLNQANDLPSLFSKLVLIFKALDAVLRTHKEVGAYDRAI
jgi:hypothetical protein